MSSSQLTSCNHIMRKQLHYCALEPTDLVFFFFFFFKRKKRRKACSIIVQDRPTRSKIDLNTAQYVLWNRASKQWLSHFRYLDLSLITDMNLPGARGTFVGLVNLKDVLANEVIHNCWFQSEYVLHVLHTSRGLKGHFLRALTNQRLKSLPEMFRKIFPKPHRLTGAMQLTACWMQDSGCISYHKGLRKRNN